jgi:4a-hydroxytetrahydrobiopterin dehydratase
MARLTDEEIRAGLPDGWTLEGGEIRKEYVFKGFRAAISFIDRLAERAHEAKHHPDIRNSYDRVAIALTTHDEGGVTERDLALAREIESVVEPPES